MDIYPVKLTQEAIMVDVSDAATTKFQGAGRGGSDTSIDANNVFALQPRTYLEGSGPDGMPQLQQSSDLRMSPKARLQCCEFGSPFYMLSSPD